MRVLFVLLFLCLTGCANPFDVLHDINSSTGELLGLYEAPTLSAAPGAARCSDQRCRTLNNEEQIGYELARQKRISWLRLVDVFYIRRSELYPDSRDGPGVSEMRLYQRMLAEKMDQGGLSEAQWAYLVEKKNSEILERNRPVPTVQPKQTTCTTVNVGSRLYPQYSTVCN